METLSRPAARVICLDAQDRVLLMHWRDPTTGYTLYEPPGGGIDPGETPLQAARRELVEETGLDPAAVGDRHVTVQRDFVWKGRRYLGAEEFFLARFTGDEPAVSRDGLLDYEQQDLLGHAWVPRADLPALAGLQPPELPALIASGFTTPS